jgi:hypothetical protein
MGKGTAMRTRKAWLAIAGSAGLVCRASAVAQTATGVTAGAARSPADVDLRLAPRSRAVHAGTVLPGITDGFSGAAPDLGAYEQGAAPPHYGPRPEAR